MIISVHLIPKAKKNAVQELSTHSYKVYTTQLATQNKANVAAIELLAQHFGVKKSAVFLVAGATSRDKIFEII